MMSTYFLYFLIAYLPFQIALNIAEGIDLASGRILILILSVVFLLEALKKGREFVKLNFQGLALLVFLFFSFISLFFAENPDFGIRKLLFFISIFPLYFIISYFFKYSEVESSNILNIERVEKIVKFLIYPAFIVAIIGILQFLAQFIFGINSVIEFTAKFIAPLFYGKSFGALVVSDPSWLVEIGDRAYLRAFAFFPDPHNFSLYLGIILPFAFFFYLKSPSFKAFFYWFLPLMSIFLSFSRSAYLALIIVFLMALFFKVYNIRNFLNILKKRKDILFLIILIFLLISFSLIGSRFISSFNFEEGSNIGRFEMWKKSFEIFKENPFVGIGLGNLASKIEPFSGYRSAINAHNLYLDIASEIGIFGLLSWLILIFGSIYKLIISFRNSIGKKLIVVNYFNKAICFSLIWFSVQSFFETSIYSPINLAILMVILGLSSLDKFLFKI